MPGLAGAHSHLLIFTARVMGASGDTVSTSVMLAGPVLVVEDEGIIADLIESMLLDLGYSDIRHAATVDEALRAIDTEAPRLVTLDASLRGVPAHAVADRLRQLKIPFVVASGYDPTKLPSALTSGVFLKKPFSRFDLGRAVSDAAARS